MVAEIGIVCTIPIPKALVNLKVRLFKTVLKTNKIALLCEGRTTTGVDIVYRARAVKVYLCAGGKRKCVVVVLKKNCTLFGNLRGNFICCLFKILNAGKIREILNDSFTLAIIDNLLS